MSSTGLVEHVRLNENIAIRSQLVLMKRLLNAGQIYNAIISRLKIKFALGKTVSLLATKRWY